MFSRAIRRALVWLVAFFIVQPGIATPPAAMSEPESPRVVILANSDQADSVALARAYAERRSIPTENIIAIPLPAEETIDWTTYISRLHEPLLAQLLERKWIDGSVYSVPDEAGRLRWTSAGHRISYLVVCRGVPLRIEHDAKRYAPVRPLTQTAEFQINHGAVDSELSLLAKPGTPINAFVSNPLYQREQPDEFLRRQVIRVSRLDGPTHGDALRLIDQAIEAEKHGLYGRAYIDFSGKYPQGDEWLEKAAKKLADAGYDVASDRAPETMPETARFDAPAWYFGWYAWEIDGPMKPADFRFPAGSVALHIQSFSAQTLRSASQGWCGPLIARGATATFGNVYEPYLPMTHHIDLLVESLLKGRTLGEAAYYAMPALSWQGIVIGDPLYRPCAVTMSEQWQRRSTLARDQRGYVYLNEFRRLERGLQIEAALKLAADQLAHEPTWPLALAFEKLAHENGKGDDAVKLLASVEKALGAFKR